MTNNQHKITNDLIAQLNNVISTAETISLIQSLANIKISTAIAALIPMLHHHNIAIATAVVKALVQLAPDSVEALMKAFEETKDHGVQALIVQALAKTGDVRSLDLLIEVVGVEVANHCQGNVRRVAARGLGKIAISGDLDTLEPVVEKLTWALLNAQDWALRYAAVVSLQEIATTPAIDALQQALTIETDVVCRERLKTALEYRN
jgi:bilin biosynthesis PecF protein